MKPRSANSSTGGDGPGGSGGAMNGTGGRTQGTTVGTGGSAVGNGGAPGSGGSMVTGGRVGTGGAGGTAGTNRTGGAVGSGGGSATGGTRATAGNSGGGGTGGFFHTGGAMATGGVSGVGGAATHGGSLGSGGRLGSGGSSGGAMGTGGRSAAGGAVSAGGTTTSGGTTGTGGSCGNGMVDPGEQCDLGVDNEAAPAFGVTQSGQSFAAVPLMRSATCPDFYSYSSSSAHTGLEALGESRVLLYLDKSTLALSLVVFHGVDKDATGLDQPRSQVQMLFSGLPTTFVDVSDDSDELVMTSSTTATGLWTFTSNSDGGVLAGLPFPGEWEITIQPTFITGITAWAWVQSDGSLVNLDLTQPLTITARSFPSPCRLDCTAPRCGDGILDGGEICDEGSQAVNGCRSGCMSFE